MGLRAYLLGTLACVLVACGPSNIPSPDPEIPPASPREEAAEASPEAPSTPSPRQDTPPPEETTPQRPSEISLAVAERYAALAARRQSQGLLRRDRSPSDAPITPFLLARNFEAIALSTEHGLASSGTTTSGAETPLARWAGAVHVELITGASLSPAKRQAARGEVASTVAQLARATGHPINMVSSGGNFKILILSEDDRRALDAEGLSALLPGVPFSVRQAVLRPNTNARCLVVGLGGFNQPHSFSAAVALVRAELPGVMRFACIQEELAQGLGLPNDSAAARPSIFNDDDEFAVLTQHDEWLLQMLYDPRLRPGMSRAEARPIIQQIASELIDGPIELASLNQE